MQNRLAIILVNYNQAQYTFESIKSLLKSKFQDFQVFVIDNSTLQKELASLRKAIYTLGSDRIKYVPQEKNEGYVGGINTGFELAKQYKPEFYLIMNNDTLIDPEAIDKLISVCITYNKKAIVSGKVYDFSPSDQLQYIGGRYVNSKLMEFTNIGCNERDNGQFDQVMEMDMLDDVFWIFHAQLYEMIGGYNPYFWFNGEQADFAMRAKKAGYKLVFTPDAKIWHKGSPTLGGRENNPRLAFYQMQSKLLLRFLHLPWHRFWSFYFINFLGTMRSFIRLISPISPRTFGFRYAWAKLLGIGYFNLWLMRRNSNTGKAPFN